MGASSTSSGLFGWRSPQQDDGLGPVLLDGLDDVLKVAVWVAAEKDHWIFGWARLSAEKVASPSTSQAGLAVAKNSAPSSSASVS